MRSPSLLIATAVMAIIAGAVLAPPAAAQQAGVYEWRGELRPGTELRIFTSRGNLTVNRAPGSTAHVQANADQDAGSRHGIRYQLLERGDHVVICALAEGPGYPATCNDTGIRTEVAARGPNAGAYFTVELPEGVDLRVSTGGGTIDVADASGRIQARSGSGAVRIGSGGISLHRGTQS